LYITRKQQQTIEECKKHLSDIDKRKVAVTNPETATRLYQDVLNLIGIIRGKIDFNDHPGVRFPRRVRIEIKIIEN